MVAQIIPLMQRRLRPAFPSDWTPQELAEFYRVESALLQAGLALETERGVSDEGDPWFVFCRADTGEVFIHFARADGQYVVDGAAFGEAVRGANFSALVRDLVSRHPLSHVRRPGSNVLMHPAAILIALVGAAFFHSGKARAAEATHAPAGEARAESRRGGGDAAVAPAVQAEASRTIALDAAEVAAVLTGVAIGLREVGVQAQTPNGGGSDFGAGAVGSESAQLAAHAIGADSARLGALAGLDAAQANGALIVMAVFHDLARAPAAMAVPAPSAAPEVGSVALPPASAETAAPSLAAPAPSAPEGGRTLLLVHLAEGPLPQIEALALVAADGALSHVSADRVVHVDQLPALLADLIVHGEVVVLAPPPTEATAPPTDAGTALVGDHLPAAPPSGAGSGGDGHQTPQPPSAGDGHDAGAAPPTTIPVAPDAPVAPVAPTHNAAVDAAVLAFINEVSNVQVVISGHEVVFYDPMILTGVLKAGDALDSITFKMADGSSISLVGTTTELHAFHGIV